MSQEEINRINEILSCDNCPTSYACEACDITWTDKDLIKKYISELEQSNEELDKENNRLEKIEFERDKANKIIDEMAKEKYSNISMLEMAKIGQAIAYDPRKMFAGISDEEAIGCIKQYFEKKVEEKE